MYMAPELADGSRRARPSSDIFSLGVIAYEIITLQMPFNRPPVLSGGVLDIPPLSQKRPDIDQGIAEMIERCLNIDPARRPAAAEIAIDIAAALRRRDAADHE